MRRSGWVGFLFALLALGGLGAGGYSLFQAGYRQGLLENATDIVVPAWGFYPPFGLFFGLIFLFFLFGTIGRFFYGRGHWRGGPHAWGHYRDGEQHPMETQLREWHDKAHASEGRTYRSDVEEGTDRRE